MKSVSILIPAVLASIATLALGASSSDPLAPRPNGMQSAAPTKHILLGGTIHISPTETYNSEILSAIYIENGRITKIVEAVRTDLVLDGYQVHTLDPNTHIYAGFIDAHVPIESNKIDPAAPGTHWNPLVAPQRDALEIGLPIDTAASLRDLGFTTAMIAPDAGVFRGWSAIVSTAQPFNDPSMGATPIHRAHAAQIHGFDRTNWKNGTYPTSHMGVMALLRQTFIDAQRRATTQHADNSCLDHPSPTNLNIYDTNHELEALLVGKVAAELAHEHTVIIGNGGEHRRLAALTELNFPIIVPLNFPKTPDVFSVGAADSVDLAALQSWERAPANARWLANSGLTVALTSSKLPKGQKFWDNLHKSIEKGLPASDALAMLTTNPASILGLENQGQIIKGAIANLVIVGGDLFDPAADAQILNLFIDGRPHHINDKSNTRFNGNWTINLVGIDFQLTMNIDADSITISSGQGENATEDKARKVNIDHNQISFITNDPNNDTTVITGTLSPDGTIRGSGINPAQQPFQWTATKNPPTEDETTEEVAEKNSTEPDLLPNLPDSPFGPYAYTKPLKSGITLITDATIWTQSEEGILENAWIIFRDDKIMSLGTGGIPRIAFDQTIDATGLHITPGLIDAHSHTGLFRFGVNESGQAVTSEVRIADSLDPAHPGFYRQLAGGLTTAMLLHGSANPIGGQSQTIKIRWGSDKPSDMFFQGAKPGIKFALGENVKQSNWGDKNTTRYPQTRMGVETLIRDRFTKAHEYDQRWELFKKLLSENLTSYNPFDNVGSAVGKNDRVKLSRLFLDDIQIQWFDWAFKEEGFSGFYNMSVDLELEALAQILAGQRLVHAHSYRQDEILMLCRIAEEFNFKIGTFQHGLETYKVAEIVKEHAIGTSIFSDWWAYKVEVTDAIPYAGPINHEVGLLTSFNSDSDDLSRRMHVEAGKALKYAKMSGIKMTEQEALNFVTKNPAIQLGIIDRVGTLEVGKDADLAIWTGNPLSSLSRCEMTFVNGKLMFSREQDAQMRKTIATERQRIIQKILRQDKPDQAKEPAEETHEHDHPTYTTNDSNAQQGLCANHN